MSRQVIIGEDSKAAVDGDFLSTVCHDLRTPLNVIIGFSELLLDEVPGPINDNQRQCLGDILNGGRRLLELLDSLPKPADGDHRERP